MSPWKIKRLGKAVLQGVVFAYPTDTIWGFGCHPLIPDSVSRILDIKQRPIEKGLILLSSRLCYLEPYLKASLSSKEVRCLQEITNPPTTWLVEANNDCPDWLRGQFSTIAVRLTNHPFVQQLCDAIEAPLVSTSANRSSRATVRNAIQARIQFGSELDYIVDGFNTGRKRASKIKSLATRQTFRPH